MCLALCSKLVLCRFSCGGSLLWLGRSGGAPCAFIWEALPWFYIQCFSYTGSETRAWSIWVFLSVGVPPGSQAAERQGILSENSVRLCPWYLSPQGIIADCQRTSPAVRGIRSGGVDSPFSGWVHLARSYIMLAHHSAFAAPHPPAQMSCG